MNERDLAAKTGLLPSGRVYLGQQPPAETPAERALERIIRQRIAASVLRLALSRLGENGADLFQQRAARYLFDRAAQGNGGQVFAAGNGDLVLIARERAVGELAATLGRLFGGDQSLIELWTLPEEAASVQEAFTPGAPLPPSAKEMPPVPLGIIAALSALLTASEPGAFVRRQVAVRIEGRRLVPVFEALSLSLPAMEERLGMQVAASADPYIHRYVHGQLDERLLHSLAAEGLESGPALHLRLPPAGAGTSAWTAWRAAARAAGRTVGVAFALPDVVANLATFAALATSLRDDGCTVALEGLDATALGLIDPAALPIDMLKLDWSPRLPALAAAEARKLAQALWQFGPERVVLQRAETEAALLWGRAKGLGMFQGRHVDLMLAAERMRACPHSGRCALRACIGRAAAVSADGQAGCLDPARLGDMIALQQVPAPLGIA